MGGGDSSSSELFAEMDSDPRALATEPEREMEEMEEMDDERDVRERSDSIDSGLDPDVVLISDGRRDSARRGPMSK